MCTSVCVTSRLNLGSRKQRVHGGILLIIELASSSEYEEGAGAKGEGASVNVPLGNEKIDPLNKPPVYLRLQASLRM